MRLEDYVVQQAVQNSSQHLSGAILAGVANFDGQLLSTIGQIQSGAPLKFAAQASDEQF